MSSALGNHDIAPGFNNPPHESQQVFRGVLEAFAHPGRIVRDAQAALLDRTVGARSQRVGEILRDDFRQGRTRQLRRALDKRIDASPRYLRKRTAVQDGEASTNARCASSATHSRRPAASVGSHWAE